MGDHFMRLDTVSNGRDCIYPQVSRNYNIGQTGGTMDAQWYNQYLRPMQFDAASRVAFRDLDLSYLEFENYEQSMFELFASEKTKFIGIFHDDLDVGFFDEPMDRDADALLIGYHGYKWPLIARKFGLLENGHRTKHKNTIMIKRMGILFIFANVRLSPYLEYHPQTVGLSERIKNGKMKIVAGENGASCDDVCDKGGMRCLHDHFEYVNKCSVLQKYFGCEKGCLGGVVGEDVPNYVSQQKPGLFQKCLVSDFEPKCGAK